MIFEKELRADGFGEAVHIVEAEADPAGLRRDEGFAKVTAHDGGPSRSPIGNGKIHVVDTRLDGHIYGGVLAAGLDRVVDEIDDPL
jgi:hypothetical protein